MPIMPGVAAWFRQLDSASIINESESKGVQVKSIEAPETPHKSTSSYKPYRLTLDYITHQYQNSGISWHEAFQRSGGKEVWGHHNHFTEHWWNKFPPQKLERLAQFEIELFNLSIEEIARTVQEDALEFDRMLNHHSLPSRFYEFYNIMPMAIQLPKFDTIEEAIEYVNSLEYKQSLRGRWIDDLPFRKILFRNDGTYNIELFRPEFIIDDNGSVTFITDYESFTLRRV